MADPWEIPPRPAYGDPSPRATHVARSSALDEWERVEVQLFLLDVFFSKALGARGEYGDGTTFTGRTAKLERAAQRYFIKHPDQQVEADFCVLCCHLQNWAQRRHDIAHGMVEKILTKENMSTHRAEYALISPFYGALRKPIPYFPEFAYNARALDEFRTRFSEMWKRVILFTERLFPSES
jgi:hypothetical protein